jgi:SAM-dependent methyltransferase
MVQYSNVYLNMRDREHPVNHGPPLSSPGGRHRAIEADAYRRWRDTELGAVTEALEHRLLIDLMGSVEGRRVLDLGCGDGLMTTTLSRLGARSVGVDLDRATLTAAVARIDAGLRPSASFVEGRAENLPFPDQTFDVVVALTLLCMVPDQPAVIREAARVLRSGGTLVIGDLGRWNAWAARRRVRGWLGSPQWRAARFTTRARLSGLVERAGLTVTTVRGAVYYPPIRILARAMAHADRWLGARTTIGAAFLAVAAIKP